MRSPSSLLLTPRFRFPLALLAVTLLAAGCATRRPAPVEDRIAPRSPQQGPQVVAPGRAPAGAALEPPAATYTVKRGDTLHQIALDTGLDYRELAAWNNIDNVDRIYPGQVLRLTAPGTAPALAQQGVSGAPTPPDAASGVTTAPLRTVPSVVEGKPAPGPVTPSTMSAAPPSAPAIAAAPGSIPLKTSPKAIRQPYSEQAVRDLNFAASAGPAPPDALAMAAPGGVGSDTKPEARPAVTPSTAPSPGAAQPAPPAVTPPAAAGAPQAANPADADRLDWAWPAKGKVIAGFSETANLKGIDIAGTAGEAVRASAPGRVVYAGSGLRGYGKLIIIKHNATYLSAYAHNREILVKEGQQVTRGQKIAEMGNTDANQVKLHFEIRRHGKPMDPTKYLPPG